MTSGTPPPGTPRKPDEPSDQQSDQQSEQPPSEPPPGPPIPPARPPSPSAEGPGVPQGKRKRDRLPFVIVGAVIGTLAAICCLGGALVLFERRTTPQPTRSPLPPMPTTGRPSPSVGPSGSEGGGGPISRAGLIGGWRQTYTITLRRVAG